MKIFKNKKNENIINKNIINKNMINNDIINKNIINKDIINNIKSKIELENLKRETNGQGAAEYILLFGGVIVIAIAALMIYKSYFSNAQTDLNASNDFKDLRNAMNST